MRGRFQAEQSVCRVEFEVLEHGEPLHQAVTGHALVMGEHRSIARPDPGSGGGRPDSRKWI
ncbi:MAG: hypothetical protein H8K10_07065 [Nitrospira sp.]|nr:hypothetical protein [Nitrospira sp.]